MIALVLALLIGSYCGGCAAATSDDFTSAMAPAVVFDAAAVPASVAEVPQVGIDPRLHASGCSVRFLCSGAKYTVTRTQWRGRHGGRAIDVVQTPTITVGDGNNDIVTVNFGFPGGGTITVGNGNGDAVNDELWQPLDNLLLPYKNWRFRTEIGPLKRSIDGTTPNRSRGKNQMTAITDTGPGQLNPLALSRLCVGRAWRDDVAIVSHETGSSISSMSLCGVLWTGIDLFMGFVIGPILRKVSLSVRREIIVRLPRAVEGTDRRCN
jgi:hypothetical protein